MNNMLSPDVIVSIIGGVAVTASSAVFHNFFGKSYARLVVLLVALVLGVVYAAFQFLLPADFQEKILNFMFYSLSTGVFIYEFVYKYFFTVTAPTGTYTTPPQPVNTDNTPTPPTV